MSSSYDLILIGAGPCGLAAAAGFKREGLNYLHLEAGRLAQTIHNFPTKIRLYSRRRNLEIDGVPHFGKPDEPPTREEYIEYLHRVSSERRLAVRTNSKAIYLGPVDGVHHVRYADGDGKHAEAHAPNLVVASGGYYAPQLLGIPGEDRPEVSHYYRTECDICGGEVVVVGGGNSALEAAASLAEKGARVTVSYRGGRLPEKKIKPWVLSAFKEARRKRRIQVLYRSNLCGIGDGCIELATRSNEKTTLRAEQAFLLTGYGPDYAVLKDACVPFHKRTRKPLFDPKTLQTRVPGIFLCGTVVLKWQGGKASIENTRDHGKIILRNLRPA